MFRLPPPAEVVLSAPVSVIAAVQLEAGGIVLIADRGLHDPGRRHPDGTPFIEKSRPKLIVTGTGVAVAVAGVVGTSGPGAASDLLTSVPARVGPASTAIGAADAVYQLFTEIAGDVRAHAASQPVPGAPQASDHTVALVAGPDPTGPRLFLVALTAHGDCVFQQVRRPGLAFAPTPEDTAHMQKAVGNAAAGTADAAISLLSTELIQVAHQKPAEVTQEHDTAVVHHNGAGPAVHHPAPEPREPPLGA